MKISKKVLLSLLGLSLLVLMLLSAVSFYGFQAIKVTSQEQNKLAMEELYDHNMTEITKTSSDLAISLANYYSQTIDVDFQRIMGELNTMKGDIETLYNQGGVKKPATIRRPEDYIVSVAVELTDEEIQSKLEKLSITTAMFDNMLAIEPDISFVFFVLDNGMVITSTGAFIKEYEHDDMRQMGWCKRTVETGETVWSDLYIGTDYGLYITCAVPIYVEDNQFIGVLAFDVKVSEIAQKTLSIKNDLFLSSFIMNRQGEILFSSIDVEEIENEPYFQTILHTIDLDLTESGYYSDDAVVFGYAPIESTNWILVTAFNYEAIMAPIENISKSVSNTGEIMERVIVEETRKALIFLGIITLMILMIVVMIATRLSKSITQPIAILSQGAKMIGEGDLDYKFEDLGNDEIGMLAATFNVMTLRLKNYIGEVAKSAAEKQRIESELNVARDIQLGMLPKQIEGPGYEVSGMMLPAKEVGGDFYDFFLLGEDKLCFVVADVSGKGVGAALFMAISKVIIKTAAQASDVSVDELLMVANDLLCEDNPAELFVTVYVGIMEISTGEISYSSAGHNPPVLIKSNGKTEYIPIKPKLPLAAMDGIKYPIMKMKIEEGEMLLLYTDGVTEATNLDNQLYGDNRLLASSKGLQNMEIHDVISYIKADVDLFVGEAPQFDDIAIVAIRKTT